MACVYRALRYISQKALLIANQITDVILDRRRHVNSPRMSLLTKWTRL